MGGKPIGSCEIASYARSRGAYVIVADYLPEEASPAKALADEAWDVSTADLETLEALCREIGVTAVMAGVHEFNIAKAIELCERLGIKFYCSGAQWALCNDKGAFKSLCLSHGIDVARRYDEADLEAIPFDAYPVVVKPLDGSGSRGFAKCGSPEEARAALRTARENSLSGNVLIEEFVDADAVIVHYTAHNGKVVYSGMADKLSRKMGEDGAPVMAFQTAPSIHEAEYLAEVDSKAVGLFESLGIEEGPLWVEAFYKSGRFVFNEMGYRFGGSMTNHMVKELCDIDQMKLLYEASIGMSSADSVARPSDGKLYAIWPTHLKPGVVASIEGLEAVKSDPCFVACAIVHEAGDEISQWGSAQQVFAYFHFAADNVDGLLGAMRRAADRLSVRDESGREMLFSLFDPTRIEAFPSFLAAHPSNEERGSDDGN